MQIIDAFWEKRNIGVDAVEMRVSVDDLSDIRSIVDRINSDEFTGKYVTIKLPTGNLEIVHALENIGFRFMETQFHMEKSLVDYEPPATLAKMRNALVQQYIEKTEQAWHSVTDLMSDDMFHTDRIYLDPKLVRDTSCRRYRNWIMDLVNDPNAHLFLYTFKDSPVGFGLVKMDPETHIVDDLLEGIFEQYQNTGFGFMMFDLALKYYQQHGMNKLITSISSNNQPIVNLDLFFGYTIASQEYVLRKFDQGE